MLYQDSLLIRRSTQAACLALCLSSPPITADPNPEQSLKKLADEINRMEQWLGRSDREMQQLQDRLEDSDETVSMLGSKLFEAKQEVTNTEQRIWDLEIQTQELQQNRRSVWRKLATQFRNAYQLSRNDPVKLILNQENPEVLARMLKYHEYYNRALVDQLAAFTRIEDELQETLLSLEVVHQRLIALIEGLESSRARFADRRRERNQEITTYNKEMNAIGSSESRLQEKRGVLTTVVDALANVRQPVQLAMLALAPPTKKGRYWPVEGDVLTAFGQDLAGGRLTAEGLFFSARPGTPVYSAADGSVVFSDWIRGIGLLLVIDHGDRHLSLYGSCDSVFKSMGEWVEGGEPIGLVGQSGGQAYVGLYFEVRGRGRPLNPSAWLGARNTSS